MSRSHGLARRRAAAALLACLLATPAVASVTWRLDPSAPAGSYISLATDGSDLAAVVSVYNGTYRVSIALRENGVWESLPNQPGLSESVVALSPVRLAVAGRGAPAAVWVLDRTPRAWTRLADLPAAYGGAVGVELVDGRPLVITQGCHAVRWNGSRWETPPGWPEPSATSGCFRPFARDGDRIFAVAGAIFEYTGGRFVYPAQPEGPERVGVAVLPAGLAILQNDARGYAGSLAMPGVAAPLAVPHFAFGPLVRHRGSLIVSTRAGPARLGEGRWELTRTSPIPGEGAVAWGPQGPYAEAGGELYAASDRGLYVGMPSVRRLLPVAVKGSGLSGASFTSDLRLANFGDVDATARLELRAPSGLAAGTTRMDVPLPARRSARVEDLIAAFRSVNPDAPSTGSVSIAFDGSDRDEDFWAGADVVSSLAGLVTRTFVPAVPWGSGPGYYIESAVGFVPRATEDARTNVGWADAGDAGPAGALSTPFNLSWTGGAPGFSFFAPAGAWNQVPLAAVLPAVTSGGILGLSGPAYYGGPNCCWGYESIAPRDLVPYAVEVDRRTGDGSFSVFETPSLDTDRSSLFFPAVVRTGGAGGIPWSSDVRLGRGDDLPAAATVEATFRGVIGDTRRTVVWTQPLASGDGVRFDPARAAIDHAGLPDVGQSVVGTLAVKPDLLAYPSLFGEVRVTSAVGASGAMGATVGGIPAGRWASSKAIVAGLADDGSLRSNLALANPEPDGGPVLHLVIELVRGTDGRAIGGADVELASGERWQRDVRELVPDGKAAGEAYAVVRNAGPGRFVAYGVVHERTGGDGAERPMTGIE